MKISYSAPGKIHLLGEHSVVYGKPALLTTINLRVYVTITPPSVIASEAKQSTPSNRLPRPFGARNDDIDRIRKVIEPIVKKYFKLKTIPSYDVSIESKIPLGTGLGSSASISATYIASFLTFLKIKWDLNLINDLTFEAEKVFHGNPSGADNSIVVFGGLIWFRKETENLKIISQLPFSIPNKLSKNFILINTGKPKETTKTMVTNVLNLSRKNPRIFEKFLIKQEQLTKELLESINQKTEKKLMSVIKMGENNLESIGVVSKSVALLIREIESVYGVAKICGGGGKTGPTGILLCYHPTPSKIIEIAKAHNLEYFKVNLGVEGLRKE